MLICVAVCDWTVKTLFLFYSVPPDLSAHCEYWAAGYSVFVVWNKPDGVWTAVEVNVTGKTYTGGKDGEQDIKIPGFQPARTYEVSLASLSKTVRSSEPFVFSCSTDPRGESKWLYDIWNSISVCFMMWCCKILTIYSHYCFVVIVMFGISYINYLLFSFDSLEPS